MVEENTDALAGRRGRRRAEQTSTLTDNVGGRPVTATDDRDETLTYTLSGADAAMFRVRANGQIEVSDKAMLDHEANSRPHRHADSDGLLRRSQQQRVSITVTIYVTDLDEAPMIRASTGGVIITDGPRSMRINEEDSTSTTVGTYIADPAGAALSLSGDDRRRLQVVEQWRAGVQEHARL